MIGTKVINVFAASRTKKFGGGPENFGDNLMQDILLRLFGLRINYVEHQNAELIGVGSIIDAYFRKNKGRSPSLFQQRPWRTLHVWGSGFMHGSAKPIWPQRLEFSAVRGPLSAKRVGQPNLPVGDPALLLPRIWPSTSLKKHEVGVIPHFVTHDAFLKRFGDRLPKHWKVLNLLGSPDHICSEIAACETIISSSLHGLIVADAYDVPSLWIKPETPIKGDGFKFKDYESQRGVALGNPLDFQDILEKDFRDRFTVAKPASHVLDALEKAFPFK